MSDFNKVYNLIIEKGRIKTSDIAKELGISFNSVLSIVNKLSKEYVNLDNEYCSPILYDGQPRILKFYVDDKITSVTCPYCGGDMKKSYCNDEKYILDEIWVCKDCNERVYIKKEESHDINRYLNLRDLKSQPFSDAYDSYFFQSLGVPPIILKKVNTQNYYYDKLLNESSFRVDFFNKSRINVTLKNQHIYSLVLRLLNRGKITLNSHIVNEQLDKLFPSKDSIFNINVIDNFINYTNVVDAFDSQRESFFASTILKDIFGSNYASHYLTQVDFNSLFRKKLYSDKGQRVDFLISDNDQNIIIELDGNEHKYSKEKDERRDIRLKKEGYKIIRIPNSEVDNRYGEHINLLKEAKFVKQTIANDITTNNKKIVASKVIHQMEIALAKGLELGYISGDEKLCLDINTNFFTKDEINKLAEIAIYDFNLVCYNFASLYDFPLSLNLKSDINADLIITFGNYISNHPKQIIIRDFAFKDSIPCNILPFANYKPVNIKESILKYFLKYIFNFDEFQEGQYQTIERLLNKKDSIVLLPTGSGKSLIYQLSSLLVPGVTFVVSPITSLIDDQIDNLKDHGIDNTIGLYSSINRDESHSKLEMMLRNNYCLIYLSPERLQIEKFREFVKNMLLTNSVFTVAIDEAHCVSEWGHDFRTAYLNIGKNSRTIFKKNDDVPVLIGLTGTASTAVLKDVQRELNIKEYDAIITPKTFDRKELHFDIYKCKSSEKTTKLDEMLNNTIPSVFKKSKNDFYSINDNKTNCGIVFCPHVNGDYGCVNINDTIANKLKINVGIYSGSAPKGFNESSWINKKKQYANDFKHNKYPILVATKAFGMGIDKPNIRYTIHYGISGSIESFYQEAGRAGRDKNDSYCYIDYSNDNKVNKHLLDPSTPLEEVISYIKNLKINDATDDISRLLFFHVNSFEGIEKELFFIGVIIKKIIENNENFKNKNIKIVPIKYKERDDKNNLSVSIEQTRNQLEKGIQRLVVLGVVDDYCVDYASDEYTMHIGNFTKESIILKYCDYVRGYNEGRIKSEYNKLMQYNDLSLIDFIKEACKVLVEFIYDTIEKGRRRGIREMVSLCEAALKAEDKDEVIRSRIIKYFETSYSELLESVLSRKDFGFDIIKDMIDGKVDDNGAIKGGLQSSNQASGIQGQVSRYLESVPDHPGLLLLRAISECYTANYDINLIKEDFKSGIKFAIERYSVDSKVLNDFVIFILKTIYKRDIKLYEELFVTSYQTLDYKEFMKEFISSDVIEDKMRDIPIILYLDELNRSVLDKLYELKE